MTTIEQSFASKICAAAKEYTEIGYSCFPLSLAQKRPLAKWKKYQSEHPLEETIDDWEENGAPRTDPDTGEITGRETAFNLAIVTGEISGIVVVDCDNPEAVAYAQQHGMTSPIAVKTRRGVHYYFRHPCNDRKFRNKTGNNPTDGWPAVDGLDFRGDGGYVVAPPSISLHPDGGIKHEYRWAYAEGCDLDDMPVWKGVPDDMVDNGKFDLVSLSLANVDVGDSAMDVREQVGKRVDFLGRKLHGPDKGDSTDDWMIRFAGQMVRRGLTGPALWDAIVAFHEEYFVFLRSRSELERWLKTKMRSAIQMDVRNHPDDYNDQRERIVSAEEEKQAVISFKPIYSSDFKRLLTTLGDTQYHADPVVPSRSIIQVVGYNGHGKSFFVGGLATAMAANRTQFGPFFLPKPSKIFYLDFDNPARTVLNRFSGFARVWGDPGNNLPIWSPAIIPPEAGGQMNLREPAGLAIFEKWMEQMRPDVVVIDTVRNAFGGIDEKSPQDWFHVNRVAKVLRDKYHASVILVHHRNKPTPDGLGREAGSTAQLTDLDTQVIITQVYKDKHTAKVKAGLFDDDCSFDRKKTITTPFSYFQQKLTMSGMSSTHRIRMVSEVSFGKVREETDLHRTYYLGYVENIATGEQDMLWTPSPREDAAALYATGLDPNAIAQQLFIPASEIRKWLNIP